MRVRDFAIVKLPTQTNLTAITSNLVAAPITAWRSELHAASCVTSLARQVFSTAIAPGVRTAKVAAATRTHARTGVNRPTAWLPRVMRSMALFSAPPACEMSTVPLVARALNRPLVSGKGAGRVATPCRWQQVRLERRACALVLPPGPRLVRGLVRRAHRCPGQGLAGDQPRRAHAAPRADRLRQNARRVPGGDRHSLLPRHPAERQPDPSPLHIPPPRARDRHREEPARAAGGNPARGRTRMHNA